MIRKILIYLNLLGACSLILMVVPVYASVSDAIMQQNGAIVAVSVIDKEGRGISSGRGFIVNPDGIIVTNCRLISKWSEKFEYMLNVVTANGMKLPIVDLSSTKCRNHFAILKVNGMNLPAVTLASDFMLKKGQHLFTFADRLGLLRILDEIRVIGIHRKKNIYTISIPVSPEESGLPLFNENGAAIAMSLSLPNQDKGFAVTLADIKEHIMKRKKSSSASKPVLAPYRIKMDGTKKLDIATEYFLYGRALEKMEMYGEALRLYQESLRIKPDLLDAYINLGQLNYKLGRYIDAIDAYSQALKIQPDSPDIYNKLGTVHLIRGEYTNALAAFKTAISLDPDNPSAHFNLGITHFLNGDKTAAFEEFTILKILDGERADNLRSVIQ
jgi:hypothetical protein